MAYLRTLASTHAETKRLVENLKFYCDKEAKLTDAADASGLLTSASPEEALDRCMSDLFVPYTEADRYLSREKLALNELFGRIVAEFLNYMVNIDFFYILFSISKILCFEDGEGERGLA